MASRKRIERDLSDDCWEHVLSKILNDSAAVDDRNHYLETLSFVSKQFLSISSRFLYSLKLIYTPSTLSRPFQRFPNLTSLDLSCYRGDLNTLLYRIPLSVSLSRLTSLNLSNHPTFPASGLRTILKNTTLSTTLTSLTSSNIASLKFTDITFIADSFSFLQHLDISFPGGISNDQADDYNNALNLLTQNLSKLRKVNFSGNFYINDSSFFQLSLNCEFLEEVVMLQCPFLTPAGIASAIRHIPTLKSFSVKNFVDSYFVDSLANLKGLTCLDLSFSCISDYLLRSLALQAPPLTKLVLLGCFNYTYYGIYYLLSKCRFLKHLDLQQAMFLTDQRFNDLCTFLGDLVSINVSGCSELTNSAFFALLRNCPLLSEIRMESTKIGSGSIPSEDLVVYHQVKSLHLAHNSRLRDKDVNMFAFMFPNIHLLDLSSCHGVYEAIGKALKRCPNIRHLKFANCPQARLFSINFAPSKLEVLNLSHSTTLNDKALYAISKICPHLLQLDLEHCYDVTEKGVNLVLENCTHLREINLRCCHKVPADMVSSMTLSRPSLRKIMAPSPFRPRDNDRKVLFVRCLVC